MADQYSYLSNANPDFLEKLYSEYQQNPDAVDPDWKRFFEGFEFAKSHGNGQASAAPVATSTNAKEIGVLNLINGYRTRGHLFAATNPVRVRRDYEPKLKIENFGLEESDLDTAFEAGNVVGLGPAKLRDIVDLLETTYVKSIGAEFMYMSNPDIVGWLNSRMEANRNTPNFSADKKRHLLEMLWRAVEFEQFLGRKFVGQKRFSLEGGESLIPALDAIIEKGGELGIEEFVLGMAHRGRLSVLTNIMRKEYDEVFGEFEGKGHADSVFQGDVKYHLGFSSDVETSGGQKVHLSLIPNPSHLETVNPVVQGQARAKIDHKYGGDFTKLAPILIHGDAAVAGQGIVYEVTQMSELKGYKTGGTIHIVINNQIGFTTNYLDARSSTYCTDVAKVTKSPVFHVNGDDVEALTLAIELAMEFRQKYQKDVFIDLLCYRRHGHNEADEPSFTQPRLYSIIKKHPNPYKIYMEHLVSTGQISKDRAKEIEQSFKDKLQKELDEAKERQHLSRAPFLKGKWEGIRRVENEDFEERESPETGLPLDEVRNLLEKVSHVPKDFNAHKKIRKLMNDRLQMIEEDRLDWASGELLAYASLLKSGHPVRLSGQDVRRGTFSHRHSYIFDTSPHEKRDHDLESAYVPLNHVAEGQAQFKAWNSLLSEYGVLGFEYGYSLANPNNVVIWEAQFGDFANGAQIMMDQYISSAETKWQRMSGLIQLLPHGFEGQGPEHSSARIERYLELCARKNMQIMNLTTPANLFHAFRRQFSWDFRIPMVIFSPKKLLRYPKATNKLEDFGPGTRFQPVIDDPIAKPRSVKRVLLCSGKVYYDLLAKQEEEKRKDVAIVRVEQLYPLPVQELKAIFKKYGEKKEYIWVQEEPRNMGPWGYILRVMTDIRPLLVGRKPSPSPATGYYKIHEEEQNELVERAFDLSKGQDEESKETRVIW
jgi:2-oxoglutarate dehydrogenase E1 component